MSKSLTDLAAERLRVAMAISGVRGADLARKLGVSHAYITRRIHGQVAIDTRDMERFAEVLDLPVSMLVPNIERQETAA